MDDLRPYLVSCLTGLFAFIAVGLMLPAKETLTDLIPPAHFFSSRSGNDLFMAAVAAACLAIAVFQMVKPWFDRNPPKHEE